MTFNSNVHFYDELIGDDGSATFGGSHISFDLAESMLHGPQRAVPNVVSDISNHQQTSAQNSEIEGGQSDHIDMTAFSYQQDDFLGILDQNKHHFDLQPNNDDYYDAEANFYDQATPFATILPAQQHLPYTQPSHQLYETISPQVSVNQESVPINKQFKIDGCLPPNPTHFTQRLGGLDGASHGQIYSEYTHTPITPMFSGMMRNINMPCATEQQIAQQSRGVEINQQPYDYPQGTINGVEVVRHPTHHLSESLNTLGENQQPERLHDQSQSYNPPVSNASKHSKRLELFRPAEIGSKSLEPCGPAMELIRKLNGMSRDHQIKNLEFICTLPHFKDYLDSQKQTRSRHAFRGVGKATRTKQRVDLNKLMDRHIQGLDRGPKRTRPGPGSNNRVHGGTGPNKKTSGPSHREPTIQVSNQANHRRSNTQSSSSTQPPSPAPSSFHSITKSNCTDNTSPPSNDTDDDDDRY